MSAFRKRSGDPEDLYSKCYITWMREQIKVFPERFLTTPYSTPYHQDRNCHATYFFSPARSYRNAIFPSGRTAEGSVNEGPSHPMFFQQERQGQGSMEGSLSCWGMRWWTWESERNQFVLPTRGVPGLAFSYTNWRGTFFPPSSGAFDSSSTAQRATTLGLAFCSKHWPSVATMTCY